MYTASGLPACGRPKAPFSCARRPMPVRFFTVLVAL